MIDWSKILRSPVIAYDTETTGLSSQKDRPFAFSISTIDGYNIYCDVRQDDQRDALVDFFKNYTGLVVMHNASFDVRMTSWFGHDLLKNNIDDTVIRAYCIDEHLHHYSLDYLSKKYTDLHKKGDDLYVEMAKIFGGMATKNVQMKHISEAPVDLVAPYAIGDTVATLALWQWQEGEIKRQGIHDIVCFEKNLIPTFIRSERRGIRVDLSAAERAVDKLTPVINKKQKELNSLVGSDVNVNSSPQIKRIFEPIESEGEWYTNTGILLPKTPKGGPSIGSEVLRDIPTREAELILQIRSDLKTRDTFLSKHIMKHAHEGRVYPSIHQTKGERGGAGTGRVQYTDPAMGQIPDRDKEVAEIVKTCFLPDEGMLWVDTDLRQFEVNVFIHLVNNNQLIRKMVNEPMTDFHEFVGQLSGLPRNASYNGQANAKQLNLSMIFNSGDGAIAEKMGMSWSWEEFTSGSGEKVRYKKAGIEAKNIIRQYHAKMPGVKELQKKAKSIASSRGYLKTFTGRRLRFPRGHKTYAASGLLIQATSADINKQNWKIIEEELDGSGHMILNTHDSYSMCLPLNWESHYKRVKERIEEEGRLRVPLILELNGAGINWWRAKNKC